MKLKDLIAAEDIRHWKYLPMVTLESKIWECLGRKCISPEDCRLSFDWDSRSTQCLGLLCQCGWELQIQASQNC
ncbi:hypothetical protein RchiOBHm_Chr1g0350211 [Rosa chinensis]|uniref:Uncharacterized protein n=1 Tax=Rosa chinensis TaxID=74649 RepID=A0A2P6SG12_ROSCH|nr:hypothetical protein RchiOBHm_Chr1g0350211 [Rosa chinensis]